MSKRRCALLLAVLCLSFSLFHRSPHARAANTALTLTVDGVKLSSTAAAPEVMDGHTMVPLRVVGETIGANVSWANGVVTITQGETKVVLTPGQKVAEVNGKAVSLETSAYVKGGRVMVPLRFVGETLGCDVGFAGGTVTVNTPPFAIGGAAIALVKNEIRFDDIILNTELRGNPFIKTMYDLLESNKGDSAVMSDPLTYAMSDIYDFVDERGTSVQRYELYVESFSIGYSLIHDVTADQWFTYADANPTKWLWLEELKHADVYGFRTVVPKGGVTS
ncbi:copper amine oxidase N-terminal domain-containing protein [Cohnella sp. AR92]|uniref:copper amine oxidase N-terminal domain-containing protein n=1 Tax=Cohnella sp. AR92 TaxID=648716 RepID=UPI000F8EBB2D|nr:copper amine oxidase N-terminal domain-containing protein [Cohnella sp. AR92]RUS46910.1 copper amine oxidase N-terminal domain-containing protein [Cohnella sp. AR92]